MNELNLTYENAYLYKSEKFCHNLTDDIHIQIYPWNNAKGYTFLSHPCYCYSSCCHDLRNQFGEFNDDPLGLLLSEKRLAFWNKIIVDRDFSSCHGCPKYKMADTTGFWDEVDFLYLYGEKTGRKYYDMFKDQHIRTIFPKNCYLNLGSCCNLKCKTCRNDFITQQFDIIDDDIRQFIYIAKQTEMLSLGGDGEFFMNKNYNKILKADLRTNSKITAILIMTNGTMFTEKRWNEIPEENKQLIKDVRISIDAATPEAYARVRGPVGWKMLMKNLPFIQKVSQDYGIRMSTTFTISKYNASDVRNFYDFAIANGFKHVMFQFARDIFHPETGKQEDYIITGMEHDAILADLCDLRDREGYDKVSVE